MLVFENCYVSYYFNTKEHFFYFMLWRVQRDSHSQGTWRKLIIYGGCTTFCKETKKSNCNCYMGTDTNRKYLKSSNRIGSLFKFYSGDWWTKLRMDEWATLFHNTRIVWTIVSYFYNNISFLKRLIYRTSGGGKFIFSNFKTNVGKTLLIWWYGI